MCNYFNKFIAQLQKKILTYKKISDNIKKNCIYAKIFKKEVFLVANARKLKSKIIENGLNIEEFSSKIGMEKSTFCQKAENPNESKGFTIKEVKKIVNELSLSAEEATLIFFR